ncbi:MAG TPA: TolC family protein, partial [Cyclobacteriaceae bacterium]|nr:TolC family protein [Cyclobacteriaceae bacterium]
MKVFYPIIQVIFFLLVTSSFAQQRDTLSLEEIIRVGLNNNYSIQVAKMESEIAANNVTRGNAGFLPIVNVSAARNFNSNNVEGLLQNGNELNLVWARSDNYNMAVN